MKRALLIILAVFLVLVAAVAGIAYYVLAPAAATPALLYIESGTVEVNTGTGWVAGQNEMELSRGAGVRTKDGEATVVLMEGEIISLSPNTEIKLDQISKKKISISQFAGETLNKVTRISGITEYTVKTPTTVATVRGTEFLLSDEELDVADGEVDYGEAEKPAKVKVRKNKRALAKQFVEEDIPPETLARLKRFPERYMKVLKQVRAREIKKHKFVLEEMKKRGMTQEMLEKQLDEVDEGKVNEDELYKKSPAPLKPKAKRAYMLTKEIKKARARLKEPQ